MYGLKAVPFRQNEFSAACKAVMRIEHLRLKAVPVVRQFISQVLPNLAN
jgi:hypothetical protein